jgi:superfamily II DNA or RNA helicase
VVPLSELRLRAARARIAELFAPAQDAAELGEIRLRPDQREMISRVHALIARDGGCLLADDVGRGKTYVALAVARGWKRPLIVVPASLRATWRGAMQRAGCMHALVTHEALSRGESITIDADIIIVDESHRFRNPNTRRHAVLAQLAARCPLLLLSATPVQNGVRDLAAQLSLFLGSGAYQLDEAELVRHLLRGASASADSTLPELAPPCWIRPGVDDGDVLRAILALPPPPKSLDGGDAGALRIIGLVRAWASSRAALRAMLARRRHLTAAIEQSVQEGRVPTTRELRSWAGYGDGAVQLGFVSLLVECAAEQEQLHTLTGHIAHERRALALLHAALQSSHDPDLARCDVLRALRRAHPGARILAFSELASTVRAYYVALRHDNEVGMLTASDVRIASGRIGRDELLARFAPRAQGARPARAHERVTLLLTTDLLSEGVNLQDASVVVHLDLPWNPARLTQRVGRARRSGGAAAVHSYLLAPPASSELLLQVEERLRRKLAHAESTVGATLPVLPPLTERSACEALASHEREARSATAHASILEHTGRWRCARGRNARRPGLPIVAGVRSAHCGWLAALSNGRLVAALNGGPPDDTTSVACAVAMADVAARELQRDERMRVSGAVQHWLRAGEAAVISEARVPVVSLYRTLEHHLAGLLLRAPRHRRGALVPLVAQLRQALRRPPSLGAERALAGCMRLFPASTDDAERWLREALVLVARGTAYDDPSENAPRVVALLVFGPTTVLP